VEQRDAAPSRFEAQGARARMVQGHPGARFDPTACEFRGVPELGEQRLGRLCSGDGHLHHPPGSTFFGEAALLTGTPRNATPTSSVRVVLSDGSFERLLEEVLSIQSKILTAHAARLASAE
jgi:hypothetical protein